LFVLATLPKFPMPEDPNSVASVWLVKDDNYGLIEVKGGLAESQYRFFVLFHKDQVGHRLRAVLGWEQVQVLL
jgi:hypothetical protein